MKSVLVLAFLGLILSTTVQANHCGHDLDKTLTWKNDGKAVQWEIKNKTKNEIVITRLGLWASDNKTVMKVSEREHYIKPFGIKTVKVWFDDINLDVRGSFFSACRYGKPSKTSYKKKQTYKKKSWSQKTLDKIIGN